MAHKTKLLTYKGRKVRIDVKIAPLLSKLWKLGIQTTNSCQADCSFLCKHKYVTSKTKDGSEFDEPIRTKHCQNSVWLCFESSKDVEKLYNIVAEYTDKRGDEAMYHKMSADRFVRTSESNFRGSPDGWSFIFFMRNAGVKGHFGRPTRNKKRSTYLMWMEDGCKKNNFVIEPQLTFPHKHLSYVEDKLDLALAKKKR